LKKKEIIINTTATAKITIASSNLIFPISKTILVNNEVNKLVPRSAPAVPPVPEFAANGKYILLAATEAKIRAMPKIIAVKMRESPKEFPTSETLTAMTFLIRFLKLPTSKSPASRKYRKPN